MIVGAEQCSAPTYIKGMENEEVLRAFHISDYHYNWV
jgi:hypothetical protein